MEQYNVTGMSCAACSVRVEKAVSKVPGVSAVSVSLLTNSMGVEGTASEAAIVKAVEQAGYGASLKGAGTKPSAAAKLAEDEEALKDRETPALKRRLFASLGFLGVHSHSDHRQEKCRRHIPGGRPDPHIRRHAHTLYGKTYPARD